MFYLAFGLVIISVLNSVENSRVLIKQGEIEGASLSTFSNRTIFAFRKIPYAKPPIGQLRFKLPEPAEPWEDILDATQDGPICPQISFRTGQPAGQEDCLYLNVYTPKLPTDNVNPLLPVIVLIHGGGFMAGDATSLSIGPRKLLEKDIILVAMNYRLNVLGFLSTGDDSSPGNFGLWDQRLALQWVQDNIHSFGGDKSSVTIMGGSAAAASVILHLMSKASDGLFHRAIAQSGSGFCHWAVQERPLHGAQTLARDVGCPTSPTQQLVNCLRKKDPIELAKAAKTYLSPDGMLPLTFAPVVEKSSGPKFLEDYPENLLKAGKLPPIPVIIGVTKDEGIIAFINLEMYYKKFDSIFLKKHLNKVLAVAGDIDLNNVDEVKKHYFQNIDFENPDEEVVRRTLLKAISEGFFKACNELTIKHLVENGNPTFTYVLGYAHSQSFCRAIGYKEMLGVSHGDDNDFFFDRDNGEDFQGDDKQLSNHLIEMWTNFAKYGSPTSHGVSDTVGVSWEKARQGSQIKYLNIDFPLKMESSNESYQLWNELSLKNEINRRTHDEL